MKLYTLTPTHGSSRLPSGRARRALVGGLVVVLLAVLAVHFSAGPARTAQVLVEKPATSEPEFLPWGTKPASAARLAASPSSAAPEDGPSPTAVLSEIDDSHMVLPSCGNGVNVESCADGKPGWYEGFTSCTVPVAPDQTPGTPPVDGMTLALTVPRDQAVAGQTLSGTLTATNTTDYRVSFTVMYAPWGDSELTATVIGPSGGGAVYSSDVMLAEPVSLEPGASVSRQVIVRTATCGDTSSDADVALGAGDYAVSAALYFGEAKAGPKTDTSSSPDSAVPAGSPSPSSSPSSSDQPSPGDGAQPSADATAAGSPSPTQSPGPEVHVEGVWSAATSLSIV